MFSQRWSKRANMWKAIVVKGKKDYTYLPVLCTKLLKAMATASSRPLMCEHDPKKIACT
jgi:hypothetical protein